MNYRLTGIPATIALIASLSLTPLPGADVPIGIEIPPVRANAADLARWLFVADVTPIDGPEAPLGMDAFGADIVDLVGMRGLNWGTVREIFEQSRADWQVLATGKPLVAITATAASGGRKSDWLLDAVRTVAKWNVAALIWFQEANQINWRIEKSLPREIMMEAQTMNGNLATVPAR